MLPPRAHDRRSAEQRLRTLLATELERRQRLNPRYSLRAFARALDVDHSTLSQWLRGTRPLTWKAIQASAARLRWTGVRVLLAAESSNRFDSRTIARKLNISIDEVNVALTDLCLFRAIELKGE